MAAITLSDRVVEKMEAAIAESDLTDSMSYGLADAIREGSSVTKQSVGWQNGDRMCALSAATLAMTARHLL